MRPRARHLGDFSHGGLKAVLRRDLQHVVALYDAEIHWVDRHVDRILQKLKDLDLWRNTIVCAVSDHGDEFFEHGGIGHRSTLHAELTRIPLLLRAPGLGAGASRVRALARIYDVAPTVTFSDRHLVAAARHGRDLGPRGAPRGVGRTSGCWSGGSGRA